MRICIAAVIFVPAAAWCEIVQMASSGDWTTRGSVVGPDKVCLVESRVGGGVVRVSATDSPAPTLQLSMTKTSWSIPNLKVPIFLRSDAGYGLNLIGYGADTLIKADISPSDVKSFVHHFTADAQITVSLPDGHEAPWVVSLRGTTPTIEAMARCLETIGVWLPPPFRQNPQPNLAGVSGSPIISDAEVAADYGAADIPLLKAEFESNNEAFLNKYVLSKRTFSASGRYLGFSHSKLADQDLWLATVQLNNPRSQVGCFYNQEESRLESMQPNSQVTISGTIGMPLNEMLVLGANCKITDGK